MNLQGYRTRFRKSLGKEYVSVMFDIDGTLTEIGESKIPQSLAQNLADLSLKMPLAFVTGRTISHTRDKILSQILALSSNPLKTQKNWYFICENGALGYFFDTRKKKYDLFYEIKWDMQRLDRKALKAELEHGLKKLCESVEERHTQLLLRPTGPGMTVAIAKKGAQILEKFEYGDEFEILDSDLAVHISPKNANKDQGVKRLAEFLVAKRGIDAGRNAQKIVVIGDQPSIGKNDHALLKGKFGTPFTVGDISSEKWPLPIFDGKGNRLKGPKGTEWLVSAISIASR